MYETHDDLSESIRTCMMELLNARLADAIDLRLQLKDTADIFTEISRSTDRWLWMVEAHAQAGEWAHPSASPERETERQPRH